MALCFELYTSIIIPSINLGISHHSDLDGLFEELISASTESNPEAFFVRVDNQHHPLFPLTASWAILTSPGSSWEVQINT